MFRSSKALAFSAVLLLGAWAGSSANAQGPYLGYGLNLGYWAGPLYNFSNRDTIPYYSLFPPVYYSLPVPRTYGYSPFAYPPGVMTPEIENIQPKEIINPHVPQPPAKKSSGSASATDKTARQAPRIIVNPYVGLTAPGQVAIAEHE